MGMDQRSDPSRQKRGTTAYPVYASRVQCHLLCNQRWDPMAPVAHQFPQVAERLSLLARLETPGSVGQNARYTTCVRERKRGEAQTSHGGVSGQSVGEDHRGRWSGKRVGQRQESQRTQTPCVSRYLRIITDRSSDRGLPVRPSRRTAPLPAEAWDL